MAALALNGRRYNCSPLPSHAGCVPQEEGQCAEWPLLGRPHSGSFQSFFLLKSPWEGLLAATEAHPAMGAVQPHNEVENEDWLLYSFINKTGYKRGMRNIVYFVKKIDVQRHQKTVWKGGPPVALSGLWDWGVFFLFICFCFSLLPTMSTSFFCNKILILIKRNWERDMIPYAFLVDSLEKLQRGSISNLKTRCSCSRTETHIIIYCPECRSTTPEGRQLSSFSPDGKCACPLT